jgi:hypothetical protein
MVSGLMDRPYMNRAVHFSAMSLAFIRISSSVFAKAEGGKTFPTLAHYSSRNSPSVPKCSVAFISHPW